MANNAVVGILRALLTADTAQYEAGLKRASQANNVFIKQTEQLRQSAVKLAPQAERMVKSFQGDKLLFQANNYVAAVSKIGGAAKLTETEQRRVNSVITAALEKYKALGKEGPPAMVALADATKRVEQPTNTLTTRMVALGAVVGTFAAQFAMQAVRSLINMGREAFRTASNLVDLSAKTGESTASLQRMQFVADQTNVSFDALTNGAFMLRARLAGGTDSVVSAMADLRKESGSAGLSVRSSADDILRALSTIQDEQRRFELGTKLFGRSFRDFASAVNQGYGSIADQANIASDEQLRALDRAADRWSQFVSNTKTNVAAFLGQMLLMSDALREVREEDTLSTAGLTDAQREALERVEAQRRIQLGLVGARKTDIQLTTEAATAQETYAEQLKKVQAELAKLTPAQLQEIQAAQQLGVSTDDLEEKYGLTEGALRILNQQTKTYGQTLKAVSDQSQQWARTLSDINNEIGMIQFSAGAAAEQAAADAVTFTEKLNAQLDAADEERARDVRRLTNEIEELRIRSAGQATEEIEKRETQLRQIQNDLGEAYIRAEEERIERINVRRQEIVDFWQQQAASLNRVVTGRLGSLFFGQLGHDVTGELRAAADEAHQDFLRIQRSGRATAQELTLAMKRWREAEERANFTFSERWKQFMGGIKQTFVSILDEMLSFFIKQFLGGLIKAITTSRLGQALGNLLTGAAPGGIGSAIGQMAAGAAVPTLASTAGGAATFTTINAAGLPVTPGLAGAGAPGAAPGAGSFLTNPAFWTNPWTIAGIAGAALLTWGITKKGWFRGGQEGVQVNPRRDKFLAQFGPPGIDERSGFHRLAAQLTTWGQVRLFDAMRAADSMKEWQAAQAAIVSEFAQHGMRGIKSFNLGGFIPPGMTQMAILHGGTRGEVVAPVAAMTPATTTAPTTIYKVINQYFEGVLDRDSVREVLRDHVYPELNREVELNQYGVGTAISRRFAQRR